jgi:hypothetical protein
MNATAPIDPADARTRRLRELPRYTVVDGKDVDLEPHPEGDWVSWHELLAVLDPEGEKMNDDDRGEWDPREP